MDTTTQTPYKSLRDKIRAEKLERQHRYARFAEWWQEAHTAGMAAGNACVPVPMTVYEPSTGKTYEPVLDGVRGFAWVVLADARSSFGRWATANKGARKEYGGGLCLTWVSHFNQSMTRKEAYADAFAAVLQSHGLPVSSRSRMN